MTVIRQNYTVEGLASQVSVAAQSHAEGKSTIASGAQSHAEGLTTSATATATHAEGSGTTASTTQAHAEGSNSTASGAASHAEGTSTQATATSSHAEGSGSIAGGVASHAEGNNTQAQFLNSHSEGDTTVAGANAAHAEGSGTTASGNFSHAGGQNSQATAANSRAWGFTSIASGSNSYASGQNNAASGTLSRAVGNAVVANKLGQNSHNGVSPVPVNATYSQVTDFYVGGRTTTTTPLVLTSDSTGTAVKTGAGTNVLITPFKCIQYVTVTLIARRVTATTGFLSWTQTITVVRDASGSNQFIGGVTPPAAVVLTQGTIGTAALSTDNSDATNNAVLLTVSPSQAVDITWYANFHIVEMLLVS